MNKEVVIITDNEGNSQTFSSLSKLIDYVNTCGSMSWLPDGYTWVVSNEKTNMDKVLKWLEEEVRTNNEFTYDDYNSEVVDDLDVYLCRGRAECAKSLLNQIKKWNEE